MNTQKSKYRLLVLMDISTTSHNILKNATNFAKLVNGSMDVFQVKKTTNLVNSESQIATIRTMNHEDLNKKKEFRNIIDLVSQEEKIPVTFNFVYGNIKNEINDHIEKTKPDIVILGRRKKKKIHFLGDGLIKNLLKNHNGAILIADDDDAFTSYQDKSIGFFNDLDSSEKTALTNDLKKLTEKPLKLLKNNQNTSLDSNEDTILFELDAKGAPTKEIGSLILENNISLLCVNKKNDISIKTIEQIKTPVLILNN